MKKKDGENKLVPGGKPGIAVANKAGLLQKLAKLHMAYIIGIGLLTAVITLALVFLIYSMIDNLISGQATNIASLFSIGFFDEKKDADGNIIEDKWGWDVGEEIFPGGDSNVGSDGSGGAYPKDPQLKLRAQYIEICNKAAASAGVGIDGAWIMGVGARESGGGQYRYSVSNPDMYKDLVMLDSFCGTFANCSWLKGGKSHIAGGTVSNGKDMGSPYTGMFTAEHYKTFGGDHAVGPFGFEILYLTNSNSYKFSETSRSSVAMDSALGFNRPNPLYVPDAIQNNVMLHLEKLKAIPSNCKTLNSADFKSLSDRNKAIVKFSLAGSMYGVGSWQSWMDDWGLELCKAGQTVELDRLLDADKYWNSTKLMSHMGNGHLQVINEMKAKTGMTWAAQSYAPGVPDKSTHFPWSGLQAVNLGRIEKEKLTALISAADKEAGSGGIGGRPIEAGDFMWPLPLDKGGKMAYQFGVRTFAGNNNHGGTDIVIAANTPIYSITDGVVEGIDIDTGKKTGTGNSIRIKSTIRGESVILTYMHFIAPPSMKDSTGKIITGKELIGLTVTKGTVIGFVGNTGLSNTAHLHFEVTGTPTVTGSTYNFAKVPALPYIWGDSFQETLKGLGIPLASWDNGNYDGNKQAQWNGHSLMYWWYRGTSGTGPWGEVTN